MAEDFNLTGEEQKAQEDALEYKPGELAPYICTPSKVWKPKDFDAVDKTIRSVIESLILTVSTADEAARRFSVLRCWEERHFDNGFQYLEDDKGGWRIAGTDVGRNSNSLVAGDDGNLYPTNIYSSQGDIITGAMCRGQIKVNFSPVKSKEPGDVKAATAANSYKHLWYEANDAMGLQKTTAGLAWTDPRCVYWTRSIKDKSRFGMNDDETVRTVEVTTPFGVLESKLPMMVDELKQCGYVGLFEEIDYAVARSAYPWMGNKIKPSWGTFGELEFERIARINTRIGIVGKYITGTSGMRETSMGYFWFRPGFFYDDKVNEKQREFLLKEFPQGLFVIIAGKDLVCGWDESMDDHLSLGMFTRGFGQNRRALGSSDIPIQKRINIWADLWDKFVRGAIPSTLLDGRAFSDEAIAGLESSVTRFISVAVDATEGQTLASVVGQTPVPNPIPGFAEMLQWYLGPLIQSIDGGTPALFGQPGDGQDTVGGTQIRLQQALERIGPAWVVTNRMFAESVSQAAKCCAENGESEVYGSVEGIGDISVDPNDLKGNFKCVSETINSIPESGVQRESKVMMILDMAAKDQQVASLIATPANAREIVKALHVDDIITIDESESEAKQLEEIEVLLDGEPLINPEWAELNDNYTEQAQAHEEIKGLASQAVQSGNQLRPEIIQQGQGMEDQVSKMKQQLDQTPKYLPSVAVAEDESEDHATEAATLFAWMQAEEGRSLRKKASNDKEGGEFWKKWTNNYLHWQGHRAMMKKLVAEGQQPVPPKVSLSGKLGGTALSQVLSAAGIQVDPAESQQPTTTETETIERTPYREVKTKRKLL